MTVFIPLSTQPVFFNGQPQVGAKVTIYDAGTLTPRTVYADGTLVNPVQQPILTDANGCIPPLWLQGNPYRIRILAPSPSSVQIRDIDNLPGDTAVAPPPPPTGGVDKPFVTGDLVWNYGTAVISGRVRANGKSIGSALSGATELADPSAHDLFIWLWNGDPNLAVLGGRGPSADADWTADRALTLPDFNGRIPFGIDGMGAPATGRLADALFLTGNANTIGSQAGEGAHITLVSEMPGHTHTGTTQNAGTHQHTGTTAVSNPAGAGAVTDQQGQHAHTYTTQAGGNVTPTGITDTVGNHAHSGATGTENQSHTHTYGTIGSFSIGAPGSSTQYWYGPAVNASTGGESNSHIHGISGDGSHAHNLQINALPAHQHGIVPDGLHAHNVSYTLIQHSHTFISDPSGSHVHTFTSDSTGSGSPHNNLPPAILVTFYLVL
jgi:microcystin-dependent protein